MPIKFGTKQINDPEFTPATTKDKDGKETTEAHKQITVDKIINNTNPAWNKKPADLSDEDYTNFYRELYPTQFEESLISHSFKCRLSIQLNRNLVFPKVKSHNGYAKR